MAYTNKAYFLTKIKESELNKLIVNDAGNPTESYLTEAIAAADSMIDGYIRSAVKTVPLEEAPKSIQQISYFIATYLLHDRVQYKDIPERVKNNYDVSINFLKDVAAGKAALEGIEEENTESFIDYDVNDNIFDRNTF